MELLHKEQLRSLMGQKQAPCVSIFVPTARGGEENRQGPIRLKNLIRKAEKQLARDSEKALLEPVQKLAENSGFWLHQTDGLAVFSAPGTFLYYRLPTRLEELLVVTDRFHVTPLLHLFTEDGLYYLLALSKNHVRVYQCTRHGARELSLPAGTPKSVSELLAVSGVEKQARVHTGSSTRLHGHGARPGDDDKQELKEFFRLVDRGVREKLRDDRSPLVLAAVDYEQALYREVNTHPNLVSGGVAGSPEGWPVARLLEESWQVMGPHLARRRAEAARRYQDLTGSSRASNVVEKVVREASRGRVDELFVAVSAHRWGRFDPDAQKAKIRDRPATGDEDLLDLAAIETVLHGGAVHAVDPGEVPGGGVLAAVLRY